ncbi:hypothetical protein N7540_002256 [Penicillium herquei]|nr:hypothetical protein N7540_002256 [Penicillium herquei]
MLRRANVTRQAIQAGETDRDWSTEITEPTEIETQITNFPTSLQTFTLSLIGKPLCSPQNYN